MPPSPRVDPDPIAHTLVKTLVSSYPDKAMSVFDVDVLSQDPLDALGELSRAGFELETLLRDRVAAARRQGATWEEIGDRLGMTRQAAWEYYTRDVRRILDESVESPEELTEEEALRLATDEVAEIRRRRRRSRS